MALAEERKPEDLGNQAFIPQAEPVTSPDTDHAGVSVSPCTHMRPGEPGSWLKRSSALALAAIWGVN